MVVNYKVTYESLESAGITKEKIKGTDTGVFMGACFSDYHKIQTADHQEIRPYVQVFILSPYSHSFR